MEQEYYPPSRTAAQGTHSLFPFGSVNLVLLCSGTALKTATALLHMTEEYVVQHSIVLYRSILLG